jgi:hypothetical protein
MPMSADPTIAEAVRRLSEQYQEQRRKVERREQGRIDFVQQVQVILDDGRACAMLTRDLSPSGLRLIGTRRLLGQRVTVRVPLGSGHVDFQVRILWTCPIGEDLVENGGTFLGISGG